MKDKIKVTIGLCVKNVEATVGRTIDSVINQSFPHELMEVIVVDGYSKDRTLSIIKEKFAKSSIKVSIFKEKKGLGMARQIVVDNAKGDYIIWVDGDLVLSRDYIKNQVDFMEKNPKVGIAEGVYGECYGSRLVAFLENIVPVVRSKSIREATLKTEPSAATEGAIWRVSAIKKAGGFDVAIKGAAEDTEAAYRIKASGWELYVTNEIFWEICRETWQSLWNQYFWYGYGAHYVLHKNSRLICLYKMLPIAGFLIGILYSHPAYKLTQRKAVFLLPLHYAFKRIAWFWGYVKAHIDKYGHKNFSAPSKK